MNGETLTVAEILERAERRERALAILVAQKKRPSISIDGPLPGAEDTRETPILRYPTEFGQRPLRCPREHCGGALEHIPPHGGNHFGWSSCLSCARTVIRWLDDHTREVPRGR